MTKTGIQNKRKGFTLTEAMIATAIIGLLAAIAVIATNKALATTRIKQAESDLAILSTAIKQLAWDTGRWPGGASRLAISYTDNEITNLNVSGMGLLDEGTNNLYPSWRGPYVREIPEDPWGTSYFFDSDFKSNDSQSAFRPAVGSYGPNKVQGPGSPGPSYDNDNIYVWVDE
ncbi:type II secretion system protein GspG [Verrucomicrobiota bacterium]